jgi:pimeloyl-ACP methyl ester carboxylesterase
VVLVISGSGTEDRDGNQPPDPERTDLYKMLAAALREQAGVATLRYDDQGIGESTSAAPAKVEDFRFDMEVTDAAHWVSLLRKDVRFSKVILAGHSQGSLTAILAARQAPIDGWISLAGAGRPVGRLIHDQLAPSLTADQIADLDAAIAKLEQGELAGQLSPPLDQYLPVEYQPYLISWMKYDPKQEVASLAAPGIVVQGTTDHQVSTLDAELLVEGKPDATLAIIENMCHPLKEASNDPTEQHAAYTDPSVPLATGLMPPLVQFLSGM